ncbi:MAG: discoidin domain-containing protein [Pirellulales bacterium]|nr:discoidin domain-containing protein [Pirellulales bacterium]
MMIYILTTWICRFRRVVLLCGVLSAWCHAGEDDAAIRNLAMQAAGGQMRSWEPGAPVVPGYEPEKAHDGAFRSFWTVPAHALPADLGVEWPEPQEISSLIIRFATGQTLPLLNSARTQQFAQLQYWADGKWKPLKAQLSRGGTTILRYEFPAVRTQRIRLYFPELPHFLDQIAPDQSGIDVSELEVYRKAPHQKIRAFTGLAEVQGGDSLTIEPQQTRVFSDALRPTLIVAESRWAQMPCSVESGAGAGAVLLENGFLRLDLLTDGSLKEIHVRNRVTGEGAATADSTAFVIRTPTGELASGHFKVAKTEVVAAGPETAEVRVDLTAPELDVSVHYRLRRQDHFYHKWLTLKNKGSADLQVLDVTLSSLQLPLPANLSAGPGHQDLSYPVTTLKKGGFFSCIEAVHWDHVGDALTYYPGETVKSGGTFATEKAVVGVFQNRGKYWLGMDQGVREWIVEYHEHISRFTDKWPYAYCEGWSAELRILGPLEDPKLLDRRMARAESLGIRSMDGFEPMNQVMEMPEDLVNRWVESADRHHIDTGWWIDWGSKRNWGGPAAPVMEFPCKCSPEAEATMRKLLAFVKKHHLRSFHWGDFLRLWPCADPTHGHLPGKYSIYAQGKRIIKFGEELRAASPGVALNADLGWINPQYARFVDHGQHVDAYDHIPAVAPDIHLDRLYASMNRRYQFVHHGVFLHSWTRSLNCPNHFGYKESTRQDSAGFRFGLLSALSFTASVTFNQFPDETSENDQKFSRRWLNWARANKDYLKQGEILFDRTFAWAADAKQGNPETLCGMAHLRKDRGYVFLTNFSPLDQIAELNLALDAPAKTRFAAQEVFPGGMTLQGPADGLYPQGGKLRVTVPGYQVRIVWLEPATSAAGKVAREDARAAAYRRYVGQWTLDKQSGGVAFLKSQFAYPAGGGEYLSKSVPEAQWQKEPWAYDKAYLVLHFKDENRELNDHWIANALYGRNTRAGAAPVRINGVSKPVFSFGTGRNQIRGMTRCYFVELSSETKAGASNEVEVAVPVNAGLTFGGAYLDLPDQMPLGALGGKMEGGEKR